MSKLSVVCAVVFHAILLLAVLCGFSDTVAAVVLSATDFPFSNVAVATLALTTYIGFKVDNQQESVMPSKKTIVTLLALFTLFPVSAFAATVTPEPAMSIEITHLKLIWFFACCFAIRAFFEEFMLNRKIKALTAELKIANRRADKAETALEEANACLSTSTAATTITKLQADNAQLVEQTTWLSTLANNLSKVVAGTVTTLIALFFAVPAHAATSITMDANGLTINVCNNVVLSYLAFVLGSAVVAVIGAILCEVIVRHTRTIAKFLGLVALVMIPSVADAASLTATTTNTYAIVGILVGILGLFGIGALTVTRHEIAAGIIATFSVFAIFPVGIVGTEMGIDKTILTDVISGILIWVMLAFGVLQICMLPGRKADKAAAAAKKAEMLLIVRKADEKRENTRLDTWYDRAEWADSLNQLSRDARVAVLRGKPYWTNQSVMSAADKACGYRRAVLTR